MCAFRTNHDGGCNFFLERRSLLLSQKKNVWLVGSNFIEPTVVVLLAFFARIFVIHETETELCLFPTCQVRVVRFIRAVLLLLLLRLLLAVQIPVGTAGPPPRAPDPGGHCRTSTATSRSQWALPGLTATSRSQCALPDFNCDFQIAVGTAGPQREEKMSDRMSEDMPDRMPEKMLEDMPDKMSDRMPEDMPDRRPEDLPDRMPEDMPDKMSDRMPEDMPDRRPEDLPDRMPEDLPDRMPEDMPDRMPDRMPEDMSDRMPEDLPVRKCINVMVGIIRSEVISLGVYQMLATPRLQVPLVESQCFVDYIPAFENSISCPVIRAGLIVWVPC